MILRFDLFEPRYGILDAAQVGWCLPQAQGSLYQILRQCHPASIRFDLDHGSVFTEHQHLETQENIPPTSPAVYDLTYRNPSRCWRNSSAASHLHQSHRPHRNQL